MQEVILSTFEMNILVGRLRGTSDDPQDHMTALGYDGQILSEQSLEEIKEHLERCDECGEWLDEAYQLKDRYLCLDCWNGNTQYPDEEDDD